VPVMQSMRIKLAEHVARMGEEGDVYRVLVGKHEGKRPFGRPRHRWEDNTKTNWTGLSRLRIERGCGHL
jgi:hypothetical protein